MPRQPQGLNRADVIRTLRFTPAQDALFAQLKQRRGRLSVADLVKFWLITDARRLMPGSRELLEVEKEKNWQMGLFEDPRNADAPPPSSAPVAPPSSTPVAPPPSSPVAPVAAPPAATEEEEEEEETLDSAEPEAGGYPPCVGGCGKPAPFSCSVCSAPQCGALACSAKHHEEKHPPAEPEPEPVPPNENPEEPDGQPEPVPPDEDPEEPDGQPADGNREYVTVEYEKARCPGSEMAGVPVRDEVTRHLTGLVQCFTCKRRFKERAAKGKSTTVRPHTVEGSLLFHEDRDDAICPGSYSDGYSYDDREVSCCVCFRKVPRSGKGGPLGVAWHTEQGLVVGPHETPGASSSTRPSKKTASATKAAKVPSSSTRPSKKTASATKAAKVPSSSTKPTKKTASATKAAKVPSSSTKPTKKTASARRGR